MIKIWQWTVGPVYLSDANSQFFFCVVRQKNWKTFRAFIKTSQSQLINCKQEREVVVLFSRLLGNIRSGKTYCQCTKTHVFWFKAFTSYHWYSAITRINSISDGSSVLKKTAILRSPPEKTYSMFLAHLGQCYLSGRASKKGGVTQSSRT